MKEEEVQRRVAKIGTNKEELMGKCYAVAFSAVMDSTLVDRYVLGWVTHAADNIRTRHAWIKIGEYYHDPLLQYLGFLDGATHEFVCELSREEVVRIEVEFYGRNRINEGCEVMPPELSTDGRVIINDPYTPNS